MNNRVKKHLTDSEIEDILNKSLNGRAVSDVILILVWGLVGVLFSISLSKCAAFVPKLKILTVVADVFPFVLSAAFLAFLAYRIWAYVRNYSDVKNKRYFVTYDYVVDKFKERLKSRNYAGGRRLSVKSGIRFHSYSKTIYVSAEEVDGISCGEMFYMVYCEHSPKSLECYYSTERYSYIGDHERRQ